MRDLVHFCYASDNAKYLRADYLPQPKDSRRGLEMMDVHGLVEQNPKLGIGKIQASVQGDPAVEKLSENSESFTNAKSAHDLFLGVLRSRR